VLRLFVESQGACVYLVDQHRELVALPVTADASRRV
jgi:hypothetical protein